MFYTMLRSILKPKCAWEPPKLLSTTILARVVDLKHTETHWKDFGPPTWIKMWPLHTVILVSAAEKSLAFVSDSPNMHVANLQIVQRDSPSAYSEFKIHRDPLEGLWPAPHGPKCDRYFGLSRGKIARFRFWQPQYARYKPPNCSARCSWPVWWIWNTQRPTGRAVDPSTWVKMWPLSTVFLVLTEEKSLAFVSDNPNMHVANLQIVQRDSPGPCGGFETHRGPLEELWPPHGHNLTVILV